MGHSIKQTNVARVLRRNETPAEVALWSRLKSYKLEGLKFRRQMQIGKYFADFCCPARKLVVEIDGGSHELKIPYEEERQKWLESQGWKVVHFSNRAVLERMDYVIHVLTVLVTSGDESQIMDADVLRRYSRSL